MTYAENNRISHRQLYREWVLSFTAPFLLCLFGRGGLKGKSAAAGTFAAVLLLLVYIFFLIRLAPGMERLAKGKKSRLFKGAGVFFLVYVLFTAAYLLSVLSQVIPRVLLEGVPSVWICFFILLTVVRGSSHGMQRRGRMAEVTGAVFLAAVLVMLLLSLKEAKAEYVREMIDKSVFTSQYFVNDTYFVLCAFSGAGLLPFLLPCVEKPGSAWKSAAWGMVTVGGILEALLFLLPAVFGWGRLKTEEYPILPLLSGAEIPGNILARFDVIWMTFILYGVLFALGSLFHYGHRIVEMTGYKRGSLWMAVPVFLLSQLGAKGMGLTNLDINDCYRKYLGWFFVPGMLLIQILLALRGKTFHKRKTSVLLSMTALLFLLSGCAGKEPEKRIYPMALGIQREGGNYLISYGMPNLSKETGQGKKEEGENPLYFQIKGKDFEEIREVYRRTQEKYLDLGHLQVLILSDHLINSDYMAMLLQYLKDETTVGENICLFRAGDPAEILKWQHTSGTSVGEYLVSMMENNDLEDSRKKVTFRRVCHDWYENHKVLDLPEVKIHDTTLEIV